MARAAKIPCPKKWMPGRSSALDFIKQAGFPQELAGLITPEQLPDSELLEARAPLPPLRDFQQEVKKYTDIILAEPGERALITLPTGAGKTRVAVESVRDWLTSNFNGSPAPVVLWLAHSEELCEQAYACFKYI